MKERIRLKSRYLEDRNYLNRVGDANSKEYCLQTEFNYRLGTIKDDPNTYTFVDPPGGPFIEKGTDIDGNIVQSITRDKLGAIIIRFE